MPNNFKLKSLIVAMGLALSSVPVYAAEEADGAEDDDADVIIITGTRRTEKSVGESMVPIDVVTGAELENMGTADLSDMLRTSVPSYNVARTAISDAATIVRPATLRGLPPDNTLIMVNGKRRHRSGVIAESGGSLVEGSQGADISAIPALALERMEILRDGAASQYGSDAVAGVMNFILKDDSEGMTLEARMGEYSEGDGALVQLMGNIGLPLGDNGFMNITGTWMESDPTSRSIKRDDTEALRAAYTGGDDLGIPEIAQIWGAPEYKDNWNIFFNSGIELTENQEIYAFGNYGERTTIGGFYYRNPNDRDGVFSHEQNDIAYRAVVDTNIQAGQTGITSNCPALATPDLSDPVSVQNDIDALAALPANCWALNQILPAGYTPSFGGSLEDTSIVAGVRGEFESGMSYDFSGSYGRNKASFFIDKTWNPSNGPDGIVNGELQRKFELGSYVQSETNFNADFSFPVKVEAFASDLNIAFGGEYRDEVFQTIIGEETSWNAGRFAFNSGNGSNFYGVDDGEGGLTPYLDANDNQVPLANLSIGAHGFAGFSPPQAGLWGRSNIAIYTDMEADVTDNLTAGFALRYEDFESFGDTTNYKLAVRYVFTEDLSARASFSTGFRAPTPGQDNVTKVSTRTIDGELQQSGQIPASNAIAQALGAEVLEPESAENISIGGVWNVTEDLTITADWFQITMEDRIGLTGLQDITALNASDAQFNDINCPDAKTAGSSLGACLQELGVPGAADLAQVQFYTNDFATTTTGFDIVASWDVDFGEMGDGNFAAAWNHTETEVDNAGNEVSRNKVVDLENYNPHDRATFTYNHFVGDWRLLARVSYYGDWVEAGFSDDPTARGANGTNYTIGCVNDDASGVNEDNCYSGTSILDLEAAYTFSDNYSITVGASNALNEDAPLDIDNHDNTYSGSGNIFTGTSPWGFDGAFYYVRLRATF